MKYDLDCIDINDLGKEEFQSFEEYISSDMDDGISEKFSESISGSDDEEMKTLKNDNEIKKESKMMLKKLR